MKSLVKFALCASMMAVMFADASYAQTASRRSSSSSQTSTSRNSSAPASSRSSVSGARPQQHSSSQIRKSEPSSHTRSESVKPAGSSNHSASRSEFRKPENRGGSSARPSGGSSARVSGRTDGGRVASPSQEHRRGAEGVRPSVAKPAERREITGPAHHGGSTHLEGRPGYRPTHHGGPGHYDHHHRFGYINHAPAPFHMHSHAHHHYFGYRVRTLPIGYTHHIHHGIDYYFCDGVYYRMYDGVYVVCRPPYGYTFSSYTGTPTVVYVNNSAPGSGRQVEYLYDDGVFFYVNSRGEYEVIQAPLGAMVETLPEDCELVQIDGMDFYAVDSTLFKLVVLQGKPMFEVVDNNFYRIDS